MLYNSTAVLCLLVMGCFIRNGVDAFKCYTVSVTSTADPFPQLTEQTCADDETICVIEMKVDDNDEKKLLEYSEGCGKSQLVISSGGMIEMIDLSTEDICFDTWLGGQLNIYCWCPEDGCNGMDSQVRLELMVKANDMSVKENLRDWIELSIPTTTAEPTTILTTPETTTPITTEAPSTSTSTTEASTQSSTEQITTQAVETTEEPTTEETTSQRPENENDDEQTSSATVEDWTTSAAEETSAQDSNAVGDLQQESGDLAQESEQNKNTVLLTVAGIAGAVFLLDTVAIAIIYLKYIR